MDATTVNQPQSARLATQKKIGGHIQIVAQVQFLVNQRDARLGRLVDRGPRRKPPVHQNLPRVQSFDAGQDSHQCALARTILADDRQYFAMVQRQVHPIQGQDSGKSLRRPTNFQQLMAWTGNGRSRGGRFSGTRLPGRVSGRRVVGNHESSGLVIRCPNEAMVKRLADRGR